jgi:hypothetical protein
MNNETWTELTKLAPLVPALSGLMAETMREAALEAETLRNARAVDPELSRRVAEQRAARNAERKW